MAEREYIEIITSVKGQEEVSKLKTEVDKLGKESQETGELVEKFDDSITNATNKSKTLTQRLKELAHQFRATGQESNKSSTTILGAVKKYVAVGTAIAGLKKATNIFTAFDDEMRKVQATSGATAVEMNNLTTQAKELGRTTRWSASEAAQAQFEFAKAGFNANEIYKAIPGILNIATASQLGLAEATEITSGVLRMFKLDASQSTTVGDMLAKTANSTSTDVQGLGEALKYAGVDSRNFGMNLQQTLGILGKLGNEMLKSGTAGTGLQAVFTNLQNKSKARMLVEAGVNLTIDGKYRNFLDILKDIKKATSTMEDAQAKTFITNVFGEQGSQAMKRLLDVPTNELNGLIKEIEDSKGYAQKVAEIYDGGLGGAFKNLSSAIEGVSISFIEILAPSFTTITNIISTAINVTTAFFDWLNSGSAIANTLMFAITSVTTSLVAYKGVMLTIKAVQLMVATSTLVLTAIKKGLAIAYLTSTIAGGGFAGILAVINGLMLPFTGSIALVIGAVVGLGAGFMFLYKKSETFRKGVDWLIDKFKELWGWIKKFTGIGAVLDFGKNVYNKAKNFFGFGDKDKSKNVIDAVNEENKKKITNTVETETKNIGNSKGKGINTDYLLFGDSNQGSTSNDKYIHNGYYLKGTKNLSTSYSGIKNISNNSSSTVNSAVTNNKNINNTLNDYNTNSNLENVVNNHKNIVNSAKNITNTSKNITNSSKVEDNKKNSEENDYSTSNNIYNSYSTSQNKVIEKSPEEKIVELLTNIKDLLSSKKSSDSRVQINVTKESNEDILSQVVEDLTIALGNI